MSTEIHKEVGRVRKASRELVRELGVFDNSCLPEGCTCPQAHVLIELEQSGTLEIAELAEVLLLDKSTTSRGVTALSRKGWLKKGTDSGDGRRKPVTLTLRGRSALKRVNLSSDSKVAGALALLSESDRECAVKGMEIYVGALRKARLRSELSIRRIKKKDNPAMASIIRDVMTEFGAVGEGYSINDAEVGAMYDAYKNERSAFFVIEKNGELLAGGGIGPLNGGAHDTCELRKMYMRPELRGLGMGRELLETCLKAAEKIGYKKCYLETLNHMVQARRLYEAAGFKRMDKPMGDTGHCPCDWWYVKKLEVRS